MRLTAVTLTNADFKLHSGATGSTYDGDSAFCSIVENSGWAAGADERDVDRGYLFEDLGMYPADCFIDVKMVGPTTIRVWFGSNPEKPYSDSQNTLYFKTTALATSVYEAGDAYGHWTIHEGSYLLDMATGAIIE